MHISVFREMIAAFTDEELDAEIAKFEELDAFHPHYYWYGLETLRKEKLRRDVPSCINPGS